MAIIQASDSDAQVILEFVVGFIRCGSNSLDYHQHRAGPTDNILSLLAADVANGISQRDTTALAANKLAWPALNNIMQGNTDAATTRFEIDDTHFRNAATRALRAMQSTSSSIYVMTTPFLYRTLWVTNETFPDLLRLFDGATHYREAVFQDRDEEVHPLDYHTLHRLQWVLSCTREIHLTLIEDSNKIPYKELQDYNEFCIVLKRLDRPSLWKNVDKVSIRMRGYDGSNYATAEGYSSFPFKNDLIAMMPTIHPTYMHIELPSPPPRTSASKCLSITEVIPRAYSH
jgi:hypothetical protein